MAAKRSLDLSATKGAHRYLVFAEFVWRDKRIFRRRRRNSMMGCNFCIAGEFYRSPVSSLANSGKCNHLYCRRKYIFPTNIVSSTYDCLLNLPAVRLSSSRTFFFTSLYEMHNTNDFSTTINRCYFWEVLLVYLRSILKTQSYYMSPVFLSNDKYLKSILFFFLYDEYSPIFIHKWLPLPHLQRVG